MNLNEVAKEITLAEGKTISVPIGQVKEILRILFKNYDLDDISDMYLKYNRATRNLKNKKNKK